MKIGVFDSGSGGLTVTKSLIQSKKFSEIIYFGDTARVPYGNKDNETIIRYSLEALEFFKSFNVEMLIIACNTVSVTALKSLRKKAKIPVIGMVDPSIWFITKKITNENSRILIIGTNVTIASKAYQKALIEKGLRNITAIPTGLLVSLVEEGIFDGPVMDAVLEHYFNDIEIPDIIILACTHFPLVANSISKFFPNSMLVHSGEAIVEWLKKSKFVDDSVFEKTKLKIYASDNVQKLRKNAKFWFGS